MMKTNFLLGVVATLMWTLSATVSAGEYEFKGRTYKLSPFVYQAPRAVDKDMDELLAAAPPFLDFTAQQSVVKDQGDRGSCAYFAATALVEGVVKKNQTNEVNMSEEYLIYYSKTAMRHFPTSDGSNVTNNLQAYAREGFLLERDFPYKPSWFSPGLPCAHYKEDDARSPVACYSHVAPASDVLKRKIELPRMTIQQINPRSASVVQALVQTGTPVVVSLPLHQKGWNGQTGMCVYTAAMAEECRNKSDQCGGHAVVVVGYDLNKGLFIFKNSWGRDWGRNGYGQLPFDYVDQWADGATTAAIRGKVALPADYQEMRRPVVTDVNFEKVLDEAQQRAVIYGRGKFEQVENQTIYFSAFAGKPADSAGEGAVGDSNFVMFEYPSQLVKEMGKYVRGVFYKLVDPEQQDVVFDQSNPATLTIPYRYLDAQAVRAKSVYLRLTAYIYSDVEGWKNIHREYIKLSE